MSKKFFENIIFSQERTGKNGEQFTLYKFRTMVKNAENIKKKNLKKYKKENQAPWPMFKNQNDPRFIKIKIPYTKKEINFGRWLSKTGLDEIPQLINVIKGEMTLVGPRPLPIDEAKSLKKIDPKWYQWRHKVKPGLFSYWTLDHKRYLSLGHWKKLEKETLKANKIEQRKIIFSVIKNQLFTLFKKR